MALMIGAIPLWFFSIFTPTWDLQGMGWCVWVIGLVLVIQA